MRVEKFNANVSKKLSSLIEERYQAISYNLIRKLFRNKDVKVNGKRVSDDSLVSVGDEVCFYVDEKDLEKKVKVVYEDENIVVVFKERNIETISENGDDLQSLISKQINRDCFAVHRLDRNTTGLVVFAKNLQAKSELDMAFKNRTIEKFYLALVYGVLDKKENKMTAYLKKDSKNVFVIVSDFQKEGYERIQTNYKVLDEFENFSLVEVELVTGKTHQIRAHFAHIGHFVIGDEKYGDSKINKMFKTKYQNLCSYKMKFHFENGVLNYLNGMTLEIEKSNIDFCQKL